MIILDTETTGFIGHPSLALDQQPEIIELGIVKLDDATLEVLGTISWLIRPKRLPIHADITKANGITTAMVEKEATFARRLPELTSIFLGERQAVAHNCAFDFGMLELELRRLNYVTKFPWPPIQTDSVTLTSDLEGASSSGRHRLGALYQVAFGRAPTVAHRALDDARTLAEIVVWLRAKDGRI